MAICAICAQEMTTATKCPGCRGQLISSGYRWDELACEDDGGDVGDGGDGGDSAQILSLAPVRSMTEGARGPVPLGAVAAPLRARHREALRGVAAWSLEHGRPCDLDVVALCLAALEPHRTPTGHQLDRPTVNGVLWADVRNQASSLRAPLPDDWHVDLWTLIVWFDAAGLLSPGSDPLAVLLEPLRCYGGLGVDGFPMQRGTDVDFPCQCYLPHDPTCPPGLAQHIVGRDSRTHRPFVVRARVRLRSDDPALSDYQPLFALARCLRAECSPFEVHADEFTYVGVIDAEGRRTPRLWLYLYEPGHRRGFDDLALDAEGHAWVPVGDRRRTSGFRWVGSEGPSGLLRAGVVPGSARSEGVGGWDR